MTNRFLFENQPNKICSHFGCEKSPKRRQKEGFLCSRSSKHGNERRKIKGEKEIARRRKGGEEKKAMVLLLVFVTATLPKTTVRRKRPMHWTVTL